MQYIRGIEAWNEPCKTAITLGKFDGLHRGHQKLIEQVKMCAAKSKAQNSQSIKSVVCAFDMSAFWNAQGMEKKNLMTKEERCQRLSNQVDYLVDYPFSEAVSHMEAEDFIENILVGTFHVAYIVVGTDFRFGYQKKGDVEMLRKYAGQYGYHLEIVSKERYGSRVISSTYIKEELEKGNLGLVNNLLGYPYTILGTVSHGKKLGRTLGFPTMNLIPEPQKLLCPNGVYVSSVQIDDAIYHGISNLGCNPTVSDDSGATKQQIVLETFLFDYCEDAYQKTIEVRLHEFVRPEQKFSSIEALKQRVDQDIAYGKAVAQHCLQAKSELQ